MRNPILQTSQWPTDMKQAVGDLKDQYQQLFLESVNLEIHLRRYLHKYGTEGSTRIHHNDEVIKVVMQGHKLEMSRIGLKIDRLSRTYQHVLGPGMQDDDEVSCL